MERVVEDYPRTLAELEARFSREEACQEYLFRMRWPAGYKCLRCGESKSWPLRSGRWQCAGCGHQVSVTAGTIFQDTRTPLKFAALRVVLGAALAYLAVREGPAWLGVPRELGVVGITLMSGLVAWMEYHLLRRALTRRIGSTGIPARTMGVLWGSAVLAAGLALAVKMGLTRLLGPAPELATTWGGWLLPAPATHPVWVALVVLPVFGAVYLGLTALGGVSELRGLLRRLGR